MKRVLEDNKLEPKQLKKFLAKVKGGNFSEEGKAILELQATNESVLDFISQKTAGTFALEEVLPGALAGNDGGKRGKEKS